MRISINLCNAVVIFFQLCSISLAQLSPADVIKLGKTKDPKNVKILIRYVNQSDDCWLRAASAGALAKIGDTTSVDYIIEALKQESIILREGTVRGKDHPIYEEQTELPFAKALIKLMNPELKEELKMYLHDDNENSRFIFWIAYILGSVGEKETLPTLLDVLQNSDRWMMREMSAHALGKLGDPTAISYLIATLEDTYERPARVTPPGFKIYPVRSAAKIALKRFGYRIEVSTDGIHTIIE